MHDFLWTGRARHSRILRDPTFHIGPRLFGPSRSTSFHRLPQLHNVLWRRRERRSKCLDSSRTHHGIRNYNILRRTASCDYE